MCICHGVVSWGLGCWCVDVGALCACYVCVCECVCVYVCVCVCVCVCSRTVMLWYAMACQWVWLGVTSMVCINNL